MALLSSLQPGAKIAVIGASGGVGRAFVELLAQEDSVSSIYAFSRSSVEWSDSKVRTHRIDLKDEPSVDAAAAFASQESPLDLVIVASGVLHRDGQISPEKSMRDMDPHSMAEVFAVNTIGPALIAKYFLPKLRRDDKSVFAVLSARVGSIGDNRLGGWVSYRMSKAALNMLVRTMAVEHARLNPDSVLLALHPGTVATSLSKPYTGRVDPSRLFSPATSARKLVQVIDDRQACHSGGFYAYDGSRIEY